MNTKANWITASERLPDAEQFENKKKAGKTWCTYPMHARLEGNEYLGQFDMDKGGNICFVYTEVNGIYADPRCIYPRLFDRLQWLEDDEQHMIEDETEKTNVMTYREAIQAQIKALQDIYDNAGALRDVASDKWEKQAYNNVRNTLPSVWGPLQELDNNLSDKAAIYQLKGNYHIDTKKE